MWFFFIVFMDSELFINWTEVMILLYFHPKNLSEPEGVSPPPL